MPRIGVTTVTIDDHVYELRDSMGRLRVGATPKSRPLSGTFGAVQGPLGRLDPLRDTTPVLAGMRYTPDLSVPDPNHRTGPLAWHPTVTYPNDPSERSRPSACDVDAPADVRFAAVGPAGTFGPTEWREPGAYDEHEAYRVQRHGIAEMEAAAREKRPVGALDWVEHMGLPNGPGRLAGGYAHRYE